MRAASGMGWGAGLESRQAGAAMPMCHVPSPSPCQCPCPCAACAGARAIHAQSTCALRGVRVRLPQPRRHRFSRACLEPLQVGLQVGHRHVAHEDRPVLDVQRHLALAAAQQPIDKQQVRHELQPAIIQHDQHLARPRALERRAQRRRIVGQDHAVGRTHRVAATRLLRRDEDCAGGDAEVGEVAPQARHHQRRQVVRRVQLRLQHLLERALRRVERRELLVGKRVGGAGRRVGQLEDALVEVVLDKEPRRGEPRLRLGEHRLELGGPRVGWRLQRTERLAARNLGREVAQRLLQRRLVVIVGQDGLDDQRQPPLDRVVREGVDAIGGGERRRLGLEEGAAHHRDGEHV
mmetsp:Transcript_2757/g.6933  ORF Transcript_2757/g.6933 Transcript_2757/m.6933 type:complete len:349 (-) Transcript_2757:50-1096(-)